MNDGGGGHTSVDEHIDLVGGADSTQRAFAALAAALCGGGFEHVCFSLVTDHTALHQKQRFAALSTCPSDWVERYRAANLVRLDPLWTRLHEADHAFEHRPASYAVTTAERAALAAWSEMGVRGLLAVPLRSSGGALAVVIATSSRELASSLGALSALNLLGLQFYARYLQLCAAPAPAGVSLSEAERQVLTWSARGKTKKEIAIVLGTSPHTVDYHQRKLLKKLEVSSVAAAVARAISLRLILQ